MPEHTPAPTPSRAVYGFVMFLGFKIFFIIYLIWAIVPETYFEKIGIDFLPQRYWAVAVPIYLLTVLFLFGIVIYPALGLIMTPDIDDIQTIKDKVGSKRRKNGEKIGLGQRSSKCACKNEEKCCKESYESDESANVEKRIPALQDLDIWTVSEQLYLKDNLLNKQTNDNLSLEDVQMQSQRDYDFSLKEIEIDWCL